MKNRKEGQMIPLTDNKGNTKWIPAETSVEELIIGYGVRHVCWSSPAELLPDGWWRVLLEEGTLVRCLKENL